MTIVRGPRVCVTGGLGFIGSHLCHALIGRGYDVVCIDALKGSYARGAGYGATEGLRDLDVELVHADLAIEPIEPLLDGASAVVHLAGLPGVRSDHSFGELWTQNALTTARVAAALRRGQRLLLASSSSVYGDAPQTPTPEACPPSPLNPYAVSKLAAEGECLAAIGTRWIDAVVVRLFTVFGPRQRPDMAFAGWIDSMLGNRPVAWSAHPNARREFTYVDDTVRGLIAAMERGRAGETYNIAGTGSTPVLDALRELETLLDRRARLSRRNGFSEATTTAACGEKAGAQLGYTPAVSLSEGLKLQVGAAVEAVDGYAAIA